MFVLKNEVWKVGYFFPPNFTTSCVFKRRLVLGNRAFAALKRPPRAGSCLNPHIVLGLASSLLLSVASYSANLFVPNASTFLKLDVFWYMLQRWVTNCFSPCPIKILAVKPTLPLLTQLCTNRRLSSVVPLACTYSPLCL